MNYPEGDQLSPDTTFPREPISIEVKPGWIVDAFVHWDGTNRIVEIPIPLDTSDEAAAHIINAAHNYMGDQEAGITSLSTDNGHNLGTIRSYLFDLSDARAYGEMKTNPANISHIGYAPTWVSTGKHKQITVIVPDPSENHIG